MSARRASAELLREIARGLPDVREVAHMERTAFRTTRKIFATLPPDELTANLLFDAATQAAWVEEAPRAFAPVPGGWGRMGYTTVTLSAVRTADLETALVQAHALASEPAPKRSARPIAKRRAAAATKKASPKRAARSARKK